MIKGFADRATEEVFVGEIPRSLPADLLSAARRKLRYLDSAAVLNDLKAPPGNRLHPLLHDRSGQHAIWINARYRLCFRWTENGAYDVQIVNYH